MSVFKQGEHWRRNEKDEVVEYFVCDLKQRLVNHKWLTETKLAMLLGKSRVTVSDWVNSIHIPPSDIQEMIAFMLGAKDRAEIWKFKGNGKLQKKLMALYKAQENVAKLEKDVHSIIDISGEVR